MWTLLVKPAQWLLMPLREWPTQGGSNGAIRGHQNQHANMLVRCSINRIRMQLRLQCVLQRWLCKEYTMRKLLWDTRTHLQLDISMYLHAKPIA